MHQAGSLAGSIRGGGLGGGGNALASIGQGGQRGAPGGANILNSLLGAGPIGTAGPVGQMPATTGGAANGLMGMLTRPETLQALLSAAMGAFGNRSVPVAGQQVPVHNMLSALSTLAGRAASEAAEFAENAEATPVFAENGAEALGLNPDSAEGRLDSLLLAMALTQPMWNINRHVAPLTVNVAPPEPTAWAGAGSIWGTPAPTVEAWPEWPDFEWLEGNSQEAYYA